MARRQQFFECITEDERVITIVETEFKLIEVAVKMLHADLMIRPDYGAFEQPPSAFNAVCMYIAPHIFLASVIHCFVACIVVAQITIGGVFVGINGLSTVR